MRRWLRFHYPSGEREGMENKGSLLGCPTLNTACVADRKRRKGRNERDGGRQRVELNGLELAVALPVAETSVTAVASA
jgi:hypothetical protein